MTAREFHGEEFWSFLQREYDECRRARKSMHGKPDVFDRAGLELTKAWERYLASLMRTA